MKDSVNNYLPKKERKRYHFFSQKRNIVSSFFFHEVVVKSHTKTDLWQTATLGGAFPMEDNIVMDISERAKELT